MSFGEVDLKDLSTCKFETDGIGRFPQGSSLTPPQLAAIEVVKGEPLQNLSKFTPKLLVLTIGGVSLLAEVSLQIDGGYVSKTSTTEFDAVGQGDTEEIAVEDLLCAIKLLKEATSKKASE